MKRLFTFLCFSLFIFNYAQQIELSDKSSYDFKVGSDYFKMSQSEKIFKNKESLRYIGKARANKTAAIIFGGIGGFGIGFGAANMISGKKTVTTSYGGSYVEKTSWGGGYLLTGIALVGTSLPFLFAVKKNLKKAVAEENNVLQEKQNTSTLSFGTTSNGLAVNYQF